MASYSLLGDVDSWSKWMAVHTPAWMRDRKSSVLRITGLTATAIIAVLLFVTVGFPTSSASHQHSPVIAEHDHSEPVKPIPPPTPVCPVVDDKNWRFDAERDARNLGLSERQCNVAFPKLYDNLDKMRDHLGPKSVSEDQLSLHQSDEPYAHGQVRVLLYNGQLYIIDEKKGACDRARALAGLNNLYRAIIALPDPRVLPNIEFVIDIEDTPTDYAPEDRIVWAWTRPKGNLNTWMMPDFDGWAFPVADLGSYISFREKLQFYEVPFADKDPRAGWRGTTALNPVRQDLVSSTQDKDWADVLDMAVHPENRLHMGEFCQYQFPVHTEGNSWSGRLRYLHNCRSAVVIHDLKWEAHYYHLLQPSGPDQNYIRVLNDWSDLEAKIQFYRGQPHEAERVANNSAAAFRDRYLTPAAEACHWRAMIRRWKEVMDWEPQAYYQIEEKGKMVWTQRGMDWEIFAAPDPNFPAKMPQATSL